MVQYCNCCENITQCNLNAHQREFYKVHDIVQVPIAGNYFDNPIKKIKEDEIPIYEIKYVVASDCKNPNAYANMNIKPITVGSSSG